MPEFHRPPFGRDREFTVILEDLRSQFRVFGEELGGLKTKVDLLLETKVDKADFEVLRAALAHQSRILSQKADKADLAPKADKADLAPKADKADLAPKADKTDLAQKTDKADLEELRIELRSELAQKADKSDIRELKSSLDRFFIPLSDHETRITRLENKSS